MAPKIIESGKQNKDAVNGEAEKFTLQQQPTADVNAENLELQRLQFKVLNLGESNAQVRSELEILQSKYNLIKKENYILKKQLNQSTLSYNNRINCLEEQLLRFIEKNKNG